MHSGADPLLEYYQRELSWLRRNGAEFAEAYPKVASRLQLGPDESGDPGVERLIESFAFLTARIQRNLDRQFPRFTTALLDLLYPQLARPVPAMSIARFDIDPEAARLTSGYVLPRHTPLFATLAGDERCRFRTVYPLTLWPIAVTQACLESVDRFDALDGAHVAGVLRLRLRALGGGFAGLDPRSLRFYLNCDATTASALYELLFAGVRRIGFLGESGRLITREAAELLAPVGFEADEALLPDGAGGQRAYGLLHEYFHFPEKFRFFDLRLPRGIDGDTLDVLFLLDERPKRHLALNADTFSLGCTPIVNLFAHHVEPLRLDRRRSEYRLVADARRERSTEIHALLSVTGVAEGETLSVAYAPFFSHTHQQHRQRQAAYWYARRQPSVRRDLPGSDTFLAFVDGNFDPHAPCAPVVAVRALCSNRGRCDELSAGAALQIEAAAPLARITLLLKPTSPRPPPPDGATAWQLVSHLTVNHLSLAGGEAGLRAFTELLRLYAPGDASAEQQIDGLRRMATRDVVRRLGDEAWRGFCRGIEVTLELDPRRYVGSSAYLFGAVLDRFIGLYAGVNAFTQLQLRTSQNSGIWTSWPPRAGRRAIL